MLEKAGELARGVTKGPRRYAAAMGHVDATSFWTSLLLL